VATNVEYVHSFPYSVDQFSGKSFPGLKFGVSLPESAHVELYINAYLDSGAEVSLFDGAPLVATLGIDLMVGREIRLDSARGFALGARIHRLSLWHPDLGRFTLDAAISTVPIMRNLLGRDFFQQIQIGFREFHQTFLIATAP